MIAIHLYVMKLEGDWERGSEEGECKINCVRL